MKRFIEQLEKLTGKKVLLEDVNNELYDCWTTGYHGEVDKYGAEYNVSLEEAVDFVIYFDIVRKRYTKEEVLSILSKLENGKSYSFTPYGDITGVHVKKKAILTEDIEHPKMDFSIKTPENAQRAINFYFHYILRCIKYDKNAAATASAKNIAKIVPIDFLNYMYTVFEPSNEKYAIRKVIEQYNKQNPEQVEGYAEKTSIKEILRKETKAFYEEYLAKTEKYAKESFDYLKKQTERPLEDWYKRYDVKYTLDDKGNPKLDQGEYNKNGYYKMRSARDTATITIREGYDKYLAKEIKYAKEHYENSLTKLAGRITAKGLDMSKLQIKTVRLGVNLNMTLTDGNITIRAWTIIAEGPIQRPHYRYLVK
jgi:hypothetical protein